MRRDPLIINLRDQPLYPRRLRYVRPTATGGYGTALLACLAIVVSALGFFWSYDAVAHRDTPYVPTMSPKPIYSSTTQAPAPDMNSSAVARANEDVPEALRVSASAANETAGAVLKPVQSPPKKHHAVRKAAPPKEGAQAFAFEPGFFSRHSGSL